MTHQKNPSINFDQLKKTSEKKYVCPNCGKQTMYCVLGPCKTDDGITIDELERFHCLTCGSDFFDLPAMRKIRKFRGIKGIDELEKEAMEYSKQICIEQILVSSLDFMLTSAFFCYSFKQFFYKNKSHNQNFYMFPETTLNS